MADFFVAVKLTLANEGGFQAEPQDRANWTGGQVGVGTLVGTKFGITALDMPGVDIKNLTEQQASNWYSNHFWKPLYSQIADQSVANKLFDMGVLFGIGTAVKSLQLALDLVADGIFGANTLQRCNAANAVLLLSEFKSNLSEHAKEVAAANPNEAGYLAGWSRRIAS